ncbi:MAG: hypothetical protein ACK2UK_01220 [Candidatus Promineifilaceae bacterium]
MFKKITLITLFILIAGALVAGGIYRTSAKTASEQRDGTAQVAGTGLGHGAGGQGTGAQQLGERTGLGLGNGGTAQGRNQKAESISGEEAASGEGRQGGQGRADQNNVDNQGQGNQGLGSRNLGGSGAAVEAHETVTIQGTVSQAPAAGVDMILETADGEVLIGTGPGYLQEQGFELSLGDEVIVDGFWEDGEFKAEAITRQADGVSIALRDASGRPMWSGAGRRAARGSAQDTAKQSGRNGGVGAGV